MESGQAGKGFFQFLEGLIKSMTKEIENTANNSGVIQALATIIGVTITLEIIITGFKIYAGKTETPIKDLIWSITLKMILVSIALNHGGYLNFIKEAIHEIQNVMSGSGSMFVVMDEKTTQTTTLTTAVFKAKTASWGIDVVGYISKLFSIILIWAGYFLGIFNSFLLLVTTTLTLNILMLVAPLIIFLRAYSFGKDMFDQWLGAILTNFITIFILGSVFNMFSKRYGAFIEETTKGIGAGDILLIGVHALLTGIILNMIVKVATNVAEQIGKVSLEGAGVGKAMGGSMVGGAAAATGAAWKAGGAIGNTAKNAVAAAATGGAGAAMKVVGGAVGSAAVGAAKHLAKSASGKK